MRNFLRILIPAVLMLVVTSVPAFGQSKIATVDLKKLFDNYYKKKLAEAEVQQHLDQLDQQYSKMAADFKRQSDDYQSELASANDQAVSQDERDRRKQAADDQLKQLEDLKGTLDQFQRQAQVTISDQRQRMLDNLLDDIKKAVADKAKAAGDTLVLDTTAETISGTPAVLFSAGDNDLTDDVLKELNSTAPPDLPDTSSPSVYLSTNTLPFDSSAPGATTTPGTQ
ncbi:MAG TPA: OmpH family outer membrane protein [Candidatus Sulfotelmatobacter sp.]|nr:OmpH family outer membrane protein [Candidatus Sulfotelmatobacter sp.]